MPRRRRFISRLSLRQPVPRARRAGWRAAVLLLVICGFLIGVGQAQAAGRLDGTFYPQVGNAVSAIVLQADGKIIIGGGFTDINGTPRNRIARLNPDGTVDTTFNPGTGANSGVSAVALQADGKIIIVGAFTAVNNELHNRIARLNADGTVDTSFNPGIGPSSNVNAVAVQPDQKIVIGGSFSTVNGIERRLIARLNLDGTLDDSLNLSFAGGDIFEVRAIAIQSDGKVIFGGAFDSSVNNKNLLRMGRLNADGTLDTAYNASAGGDSVLAMALQADGKLLIGGKFSFASGAAHRRIARLNPDGSVDSSFNPAAGDVGTLFDEGVLAIVVQADQKIIVGGNFYTVNGIARHNVARLNADGTLDASFGALDDNFYHDIGPNQAVNAIAVQANRKILIGGGFSNVNSIPHVGLARLIDRGHANADFDRDVRADFSVWNPASQNWYIRNSNDNTTRVQFGWGSGSLGDIAVPGDYDGDARADIAVWRPNEGNWYILQSANVSPLIRNWGQSGDVPVAADYDGDGRTDIAVFRPAEANWYILDSGLRNTMQIVNFGQNGVVPVPSAYSPQ